MDIILAAVFLKLILEYYYLHICVMYYAKMQNLNVMQPNFLEFHFAFMLYAPLKIVKIHTG